ncbi:MAG: hypothetical protein WC208_09790 [Gallionella sp.]|jgi:hypothetical protein
MIRITRPISVLSFIGLFLFVSNENFSQAAEISLSDQEAKRTAEFMLKTIEQAKTEFGKILDTGDDSTYLRKVKAPLQNEIRGWPEQNRAIFPYSECRLAAQDLLQITEELRHPMINSEGTWLKHLKQNFHTDLPGCRKSIKHPDMSLKNIQ